MDTNTQSLLTALRNCILTDKHAAVVHLLRQLLEPLGVPPEDDIAALDFSQEDRAAIVHFWEQVLTRVHRSPIRWSAETTVKVRDAALREYGLIKLASSEPGVRVFVTPASKVATVMLGLCNEILPKFLPKKVGAHFDEDNKVPASVASKLREANVVNFKIARANSLYK